MKTFKTIFSIAVIFILSGLVSCAEKEKVDKSHPAAYLTETFGIDNGMPIREVQKKNFYFKACELESRRPFPTRVEYSCNED